MTETELRLLIARDEELKIEFKLDSEKQTQLAEVMAAMANSRGGWLLVGVQDDGIIVGVKRPKIIIDRLNQAADTVVPSLLGRVRVESIETDGYRIVVAAHIPEGLQAIYSVGGVYRLRIGSYNRLLTFDQAQAMSYRRGILHHEKSAVPNLKLEDLQEESIQKYLARHLNNYTPQTYRHLSRFEILRNLGCAISEENRQLPTVAAALFFSAAPDFYVPGALIVAVRFAGTYGDHAIDRATLRGQLPELIESAARFIEKNIRYRLQMPNAPKDSLFSKEVPEYPVEAYREIIVNMIAHRDYYSSVPGRIMIYEDRIEAENPGGLLPGLTLETMQDRHHPRNPRIVEMLRELGYVEQFGSGIRRMRNNMLEAGLGEPVFESNENYFKVTLKNKLTITSFSTAEQISGANSKYNASSSVPWSPSPREAAIIQKLPLVRLKPRQIKGIRYVIQQGKINNTFYRVINQLAEDTSLNDLTELVRLHILQKVGTSGRSVYYVLHPELEKGL
jgi:ATP-dependent DNA helicase RecG